MAHQIYQGQALRVLAAFASLTDPVPDIACIRRVFTRRLKAIVYAQIIPSATQ